MKRRAGFSLIGLLLTVVVLTAIALGVAGLARQSASSSHWFLRSQLAYGLADNALREAMRRMENGNGGGPSPSPTVPTPPGWTRWCWGSGLPERGRASTPDRASESAGAWSGVYARPRE